jgi:hypothetical protein
LPCQRQPVSNYSTLSFDKVLAGDQLVGISANSGYSVNVGNDNYRHPLNFRRMLILQFARTAWPTWAAWAI